MRKHARKTSVLLTALFVAGCGGSQADGTPSGAGGSSSAGTTSSGTPTNASSGAGLSTSSNASAGSGGSTGTSSNASAGIGGSTDAGIGGGDINGTGGSAAAVQGTPGVWENVTPSGITFPSDEFGVLDVLADPKNRGTFYAFVCTQGVWKTTDFGSTWVHASTDGNLEQGRPWGDAIAPDGSYMLSDTGYGPNPGAWKSTDGGATWTSHTMSDSSGDPYMFDIDITDSKHVIASMHSTDIVYESKDGGETWVDKGSAGTGLSEYVFFITPTIWIGISQSGNGGTRRTTDSGATWADVGSMDHPHGGEQIFIDPQNGDIYVPSEQGVYRSTDLAATFTQVSATRSAGVFATETTLYAMDEGANGGGTPTDAQTATRTDGTHWMPMTTPAAMNNGPKRAGVALDTVSGKWVIIGGDWNAGIWRYIEP